MNNVANRNLDVVDAIVSGEIEKLAELVEPLSDDAKMAYVPSFEEQAGRDETDFGLVLWSPQIGQLRKYALYTPELVEINSAYLAKDMHSLPEEVVKTAGANLTAAALKFNLEIPPALTEYISKDFVDNSVDIRSIKEAQYINKVATKEYNELYALPEQEKYPLDTKKHIKKASAYFEKNYKKMDVNDSLEFALNTSKRAQEMDVPLNSTQVEKYASLNFEVFNPELYNHIAVRKSYLQDNDNNTRELYDDLLRKSDDLGPTKTAQVLYELDKKAELVGNYHVNIENPIFASIGEFDKTAAREIDGTLVTTAQLDSIPSTDLTPLVGNDAITDLRGDDKLDVLASLPKPVRSSIIDLL